MENRDKTYTVRLVIRGIDLSVLKAALKAYPKSKAITEDLLGLIKYQEDKQNLEEMNETKSEKM